MLSVSLFGGASFSIDGAVVRSDLGPAGRLLACYLLEFMGRAHRRERLADLFWGDVNSEKGRLALNTAIWRIRKLLDMGSKGAARHLITIGDDVILEESQSIQVDTHRLENASKRVLNWKTGKTLTEVDVHEVSSAADGYGPFLDGYDGDWIFQERERLHCLFVRSIFELMRASAIQGRYEHALEFGRRILAVDALRESVQRNVMVLLVLNGQRSEAIHAYQRLANLLRSELDIEPMPETKRLHHAILSGEIFGRIHEHFIGEFRLPVD